MANHFLAVLELSDESFLELKDRIVAVIQLVGLFELHVLSGDEVNVLDGSSESIVNLISLLQGKCSNIWIIDCVLELLNLPEHLIVSVLVDIDLLDHLFETKSLINIGLVLIVSGGLRQTHVHIQIKMVQALLPIGGHKP